MVEGIQNRIKSIRNRWSKDTELSLRYELRGRRVFVGSQRKIVEGKTGGSRHGRGCRGAAVLHLPGPPSSAQEWTVCCVWIILLSPRRLLGASKAHWRRREHMSSTRCTVCADVTLGRLAKRERESNKWTILIALLFDLKHELITKSYCGVISYLCRSIMECTMNYNVNTSVNLLANLARTRQGN